jgi:2-dehydro-3-deoxyphosphogalactonate aldolase
MLECLDKFPLIAILRGLTPEHAIDVSQTLIDAGIHIMEVPLNSPNALISIEKLSNNLPSECLLGAGTVLTPKQVVACENAGAKLIISPNTDIDVIKQTVSRDLCSIPGVATATEALQATTYGANHLKLFPADTYGFNHINALKAILPPNTRIIAVGGVQTSNIHQWFKAGSDGVGLGSCLFKPDMSLNDIYNIAKDLVLARQQALEYA